MKVSATGIPWYRQDEFVQLRALFIDGHRLHATYDEWLAAAEQLESHLKSEGMPTFRVEIRPTEFTEWCRARGLALDAKARSEFATAAARLVAREPHGDPDARH